MRVFGLLGEKLKHSFSKKYFENKFESEGIKDTKYNLFEFGSIEPLVEFINTSSKISGLNVTIPYKEAILPYLDELDVSAKKVGAVNVIKIINKENSRYKIGYNTDYIAFKKSLSNWVGSNVISALVLGTGGAAKAVWAALEDLKISYVKISRTSGSYTYDLINKQPEIINQNKLIINTTPLGMYPNIDELPQLPYDKITDQHFLYDLIYNPEKTKFLGMGDKAGAQIKNGLQMLELQAEYSWKIWAD